MAAPEFMADKAILDAYEGIPLEYALTDDAKDLSRRKKWYKQAEGCAKVCTILFGVCYLITCFMLFGGVTLTNVVEYLNGNGGERVQIYDHVYLPAERTIVGARTESDDYEGTLHDDVMREAINSADHVMVMLAIHPIADEALKSAWNEFQGVTLNDVNFRTFEASCDSAEAYLFCKENNFDGNPIVRFFVKGSPLATLKEPYYTLDELLLFKKKMTDIVEAVE